MGLIFWAWQTLAHSGKSEKGCITINAGSCQTDKHSNAKVLAKVWYVQKFLSKMQLEVEVFSRSCTIFWGKILQLPNQQSYTTNLAVFKFGFLKRSDIPGDSCEWVIQATGLSMICTGEVAEAIPTFSNLVGDVRITLAKNGERMAKRNNLFLFQYCFFSRLIFGENVFFFCDMSTILSISEIQLQ